MSKIKIAGIILLSVTMGSAAADETSVQPTVCEFVAQTASALNKNITSDTVYGDNSAPFVKQYLVQNVVWEGSEQSAPFLVSADSVYHDGPAEFYETHIRWSLPSGYLPYQGQWYRILSKIDAGAARAARASGAFPVSILGRDGLVCAFDHASHERVTAIHIGWNHGNWVDSTPLNCEAAIDANNVVRPETSLSDEQWQNLKVQFAKDFRPEQFARNAYRAPPYITGSEDPVIRVDANNDGVSETLVAINYSEAGSISPCGLTYFDLITDDLSSVVASGLREAVLEAQGITRDENGKIQFSCGRTNEFVKADDKIAISSRDLLFRNVAVIEENMASKGCTSTFTIEPVIVFDAAKG